MHSKILKISPPVFASNSERRGRMFFMLSGAYAPEIFSISDQMSKPGAKPFE